MSIMSAAPAVRSDAEGRVTTLTLDRPQGGNALSLPMMRELRAALRATQADAQTDVVVLRASGRHFCAGADLDWIQALVSGDVTLWEQGIDELLGVIADLHACVKPVLARVHGAVVGGGVSLLCMCDAVIASSAAQWRLPELKLGMVPTAVMPPLLQRVTPAAAARLLYEDRAWDAASALAFGLATEVVDPGGLDQAVQARVREWLALPAPVFRDTKRLMHELRGAEFQRQLAAVRPHAMGSLQGAEARQRVGALLARRAA